MNLDEFIADLRLILDDSTDRAQTATTKYSDAMLASVATRQLQSLSRIQIQRDQGYHNTLLMLRAEDAKEVVRGIFQWSLPTWVANIVEVWERSRGSDTDETQNTPYLWASPVLALSAPIEKRGRSDLVGWDWDGNRSFRLCNWSYPPNLALKVAKLPARLFKATLGLASTSKGRCYMPNTLMLGTEDRVEGAYINAEVQFSTSNDPSNLGQIRRIVYSKSGNIDIAPNDRRTTLFFESDVPTLPATTDIVQSVFPWGDEHLRYLMLKTVWSCFEQTANIPGMKAIQGDLTEEAQHFNAFVTPRDTYGPQWKSTGEFSGSEPYNPDRSQRMYQ